MEVPDEPAAALRVARQLFTQAQLAHYLGRNEKTVGRWERGETRVPKLIVPALRQLLNRPPRQAEPSIPPSFTFIDLFAGIGGMRAGFEPLGGRCVYTSEWDSYAVKTYTANHSNGHTVDGDITKVDKKTIPDHDLLLAGFPCQPFSLAGVSKKNSLGRSHGFKDETQGTLFFDIVEILGLKRPPVFVLENVKNLRGHDGGRTFKVVTGALQELGYTIQYKIVNAEPWVPQHRERIFIVGFREPTFLFNFELLDLPTKQTSLADILHKSEEEPDPPFTIRDGNKTVVDPKYTLTDNLWAYLQAYAEKHRKAGNGFGYSAFGPEDIARTLSARYYKDGSEILIKQPGKNPRRLTPRECARLVRPNN